MFFLRLLGTVSIEGPGGVVTGRAARRHALALLALLALSDSRRLSRDKLIGYLWPESDTAAARNLLNQSVHALRRALGAEAIRSERDELVVSAEAVGCDVWAFEEALSSGEAERAVELYAGSFADGFFLADALEFERWVDGERVRLRQAYLMALEELAKGTTAEGDLEAAARYWRAMIAEEPYSSNATLGLMEALEATGDRAGAIREAEAHAQRLREDLEAAPSPEVLALAERIRTRPTVSTRAASPSAASAGVLEGWAAAPEPVRLPSRPGRDRVSSSRRLWRGAAILGVGLGLLAVASWAVMKASPGGGHEVRRLAVLPLANLTGDPGQDYFVAGMHDALITELGRIAALTVISRQSVIRYQDSEEPLAAIARTLGVEALVEGSVFLAGDSVRIAVQLVRADPEEHLWADTYYGELGDALALQREVARAIARAIDAQVAPAVQERLATGRAVGAEAQEAYLRGIYHLERLANTAAMLDSERLETKRAAVYYLEEAVALDPGWAAAHAGLARAYHDLVSGGVVGDEEEREFYPKAKAAALRALELDETESQAHAALGLVLLHYEWDWAGAERSIRRALELAPSAQNHWTYADYLRAVGRLDESVAHFQLAEERNPLSEVLKLQLARTYSCAGRHPEAIAKLEQVRSLLGGDAGWLARVYLGWEYLAESMHAEGLAELEAAVALSDSDLTAMEGLAYGYARAGRLDEARTLAAWLKGRPHHDSGAWTLLLAALGETDRAVERLRASVERRSSVPHLRCTYTYRELQNDPRVKEIVRRVGLPE